MAYSAKHLKESLGQGEDMERDDERVETHISGVRNLSEEAREMRAAGRKLVGEVEEKADDLSDYRRLSGSVKKLKESVDAQRAEVNRSMRCAIWSIESRSCTTAPRTRPIPQSRPRSTA